MRLNRKLHLTLLKIALVILVFLFCLQWLIPALGLYSLKNWYGEQGEGYELEVGDWQFSPWRGLVELNDVTFRYAEQTSSFNQMHLNIAMLGLVEHKLVIEEATFDGLVLSVTQGEQGFELLGLSSKALLAQEKSNQTLATSDNQNNEASNTQDTNSAPWVFEVHKIELNNHSLSFNHVSLDAAIEVRHIQIKGTNQFEDLALNSEFIVKSLHSQSPKIAINDPVLVKINGLVTHLLENPVWQGEVILENMKLVTPWLPDSGFKRLTLSGMTFSSEKQLLSALNIEELYIEEDLLALKQYHAQDIAFSANTLSTGLHEWSGLTATLKLNKDGGLEHLTLDDKVDENQTELEKTKKDSAKMQEKVEPFKLLISEVRQKPEQSALIKILNPHVNPKLNIGISVSQLQVKNLNNQQENIQLSIEAKADEYSHISLNADVTTRDKINGDVTLKIDQFDLIPLNGYVAKSIGYHVDQGQLNLDAQVNIKQGKLSGKGQLVIRNSYLEPENQATMDRISKQISMPIETALSLIKDDNNNMKMSIPIKGDINAPDFGLDDLISQLSQKALTSATLHYIQQAIFPYGLLMSVAGYVGDELFSISLTPITLNDSKFDEKQEAYLVKVVSLMQDKESLQLRVCAQVSNSEKLDDWHELALDRAKLVKRFLVDQDNTLSSRIVLCEPKVGKITQIRMGF